MLRPQVAGVIEAMSAAIKQEEDEKFNADKPIRQRLKRLGMCPGGFGWHREGRGWRCNGGVCYIDNYDQGTVVLATAPGVTCGFPVERAARAARWLRGQLHEGGARGRYGTSSAVARTHEKHSATTGARGRYCFPFRNLCPPGPKVRCTFSIM